MLDKKLLCFFIIFLIALFFLPFALMQNMDGIESGDLLMYYAAVFAASCTGGGLGLLAYSQNKQLGAQNERLLRLEEEKQTPYVNFYSYDEKLHSDYECMKYSVNPSKYHPPIILIIKNISEIDIESIELYKLEVYECPISGAIRNMIPRFSHTPERRNGLSQNLNSGEMKRIMICYEPESVFRLDNGSSLYFKMEFKLFTYTGSCYMEYVEMSCEYSEVDHFEDEYNGHIESRYTIHRKEIKVEKYLK